MTVDTKHFTLSYVQVPNPLKLFPLHTNLELTTPSVIPWLEAETGSIVTHVGHGAFEIVCRLISRYSCRLQTSHSPFPDLQVRAGSLDAPGLSVQVGLSLAVLASLSAAQGSGGRDLGGGGRRGAGLLEGSDEGPGGLGGQVFVEVVVDLDHGRVDAGAQALDLDEGEEAVLGRLALLDAELLLDRLDNGVAATASQLAGCLFIDC